ncbi:putative fatty acid repression mutant protein [Aspergillus ruber CBS 135680]|uniref:Putative fatty acid repression mutant protein n=1 Tax=Aspergillus ruber (strain CBS 135680) TaxID=1388766 RepID=A0A017S4H5_ASPRC|nr:putative fatty acid repression mutant protein [Aspergillus ruber CBS 135680]EYE91746.1 putative fatty acid repression mutant protein [Aspergillus ruber CBS 135680]
MASLANAISDGFRGRRSIYSLTNESTISDERLEELIAEVVQHTPSSFNSQTTRIVVLLKEENRKLWEIAREVASSSIPPELYEKLFKNRIGMSGAAYGSVLFYEDPAPTKALSEKFSILKDQFPEWASHSTGMHQFATWTLLEAEGLGCNLQHYNEILQERASQQWSIPQEWRLTAQLVFGKPAGPPRDKTFEPLDQRLFVYGKST